MKIAIIALLLTSAAVSAAVNAQALYQCHTEAGIIYSDQPCAADSATLPPMPVATPSNGAEVARQQRMSEQLTRARRQREAQQDRAEERSARLAQNKRKQCAALALQVTWAEQDAASASSRQRAARGLKARRAAEKLASACPA